MYQEWFLKAYGVFGTIYRSLGGGSAPPQVSISSLSQTSGERWGAAKNITINGTGFTNPMQAKLNGVNLATTFVSATALSILVPALAHYENGIKTITVDGATGSQNYTVSYAANVLTHHRADQGISVSSGSLVQTWADLVGNDPNKNYVQLTPGNQFTVTPNQANGQTCLRTAGNRFMKSGVFAIPPSQPVTRFFVGLAGGTQIIYDSLSVAARNQVYTSGGGGAILTAGVGFSSGALVTSLSAIAVVWNGTTSSIRVNKYSPNATGNAGAQNATGYTLGAGADNQYAMVGDVYEVLTFNGALTDAEIARVLDYISARYAIGISA